MSDRRRRRAEEPTAGRAAARTARRRPRPSRRQPAAPASRSSPSRGSTLPAGGADRRQGRGRAGRCASSTCVGGHLILVGRALSWLPRRPFRFANYLEAGRVHRLRQPADRAARRRVHRHGDVAAVGVRVPPVRPRVVRRRHDRQGARARARAGADLADARRPRRAPASRPSSARCGSPSRSTRSSRWPSTRSSSSCCRA